MLVTIPFQRIEGVDSLVFETDDMYPPAIGVYEVDPLTLRLVEAQEMKKCHELRLNCVRLARSTWNFSFWNPLILILRVIPDEGSEPFVKILLVACNEDGTAPMKLFQKCHSFELQHPEQGAKMLKDLGLWAEISQILNQTTNN